MAETTEELKAELMQMERDMSLMLARVRSHLAVKDEENRRLATENENAGFNVFTHAEAAEKFQVSQDTFAKLRDDYNFPYFKMGHQYRYTTDHLTTITEIMTRREAGKAITRPRRIA